MTVASSLRSAAKWKFALAGAAIAVLAGAAIMWRALGPAVPPGKSAARAAPEFVGSAACAGCHANETKAWTGSHHQLAMQEANAATVLGDFDNARFGHYGVEIDHPCDARP